MAVIDVSLFGSDWCINPVVLRVEWWFDSKLLNLMKSTAGSLYLFSCCFQRVRWVMQLFSDSSSARHHLTPLSWRSRWIILCTVNWWMPASREMTQIDRCIFGSSFWLSRRSSTNVFSLFSLTRIERGLPLPCCRWIVPVLEIFFNNVNTSTF